MQNRKIIQFGPPRTGSTLVFNFLRELFPEHSIEKHHCLIFDPFKYPVVVTYRHPLDCVASCIERYRLDSSWSEIWAQLRMLKENGIWNIFEIKDQSNVLFLQYEAFYNNHDFVFDKLEAFFGIKISEDTRRQLSDRYSIPSVLDFTEKFKSFEEYDRMTCFHGNHISKYNGEPYHFREYFSTAQIVFLALYFHKFLDTFGYEINVHRDIADLKRMAELVR